MTLRLLTPATACCPAEYLASDPVSCVVCGWQGDADANSGEYSILEGLPPSYKWAQNGDQVCQDCTLSCECGDDLLTVDGYFLGAVIDGELLCWFCVGEALAPEGFEEAVAEAVNLHDELVAALRGIQRGCINSTLDGRVVMNVSADAVIAMESVLAKVSASEEIVLGPAQAVAEAEKGGR